MCGHGLVVPMVWNGSRVCDLPCRLGGENVDLLVPSLECRRYPSFRRHIHLIGDFGARCFLGGSTTCRPVPGGRFAAATSRRRALSRDQPVTDITSSRTRPLSVLLAFAYAFAYLLVTSVRDCIDNLFLMPHHTYRFAGIPT